MNLPHEGLAAGRMRWLDARHAAIVEDLPDVPLVDNPAPAAHV
jgi:hypothetical protein